MAGRPTLLAPAPWLSREVFDDLRNTAARWGAPLAIVNPDRHLPSRQLVRQQLASGRLGEPGLVRIHRWDSGGTAAQAAAAATPLPTPLMRDIDLAVWLMGASPDLVYAVERAGDSGPLIQVHLGFPGGMALLDHAARVGDEHGYQSLTVIGSTGAAYADDHQNSQLLFRGGTVRALPVGEGTTHLGTIARDFFAALDAGRDLSASLDEWETALSTAEAARRSAASGSALPLEGR